MASFRPLLMLAVVCSVATGAFGFGSGNNPIVPNTNGQPQGTHSDPHVIQQILGNIPPTPTHNPGGGAAAAGGGAAATGGGATGTGGGGAAGGSTGGATGGGAAANPPPRPPTPPRG